MFWSVIDGSPWNVRGAEWIPPSPPQSEDVRELENWLDSEPDTDYQTLVFISPYYSFYHNRMVSHVVRNFTDGWRQAPKTKRFHNGTLIIRPTRPVTETQHDDIPCWYWDVADYNPLIFDAMEGKV